jgi:hypothetical protein
MELLSHCEKLLWLGPHTFLVLITTKANANLSFSIIEINYVIISIVFLAFVEPCLQQLLRKVVAQIMM